MPAVTVEITRFVDSSFPGWVELMLIDANGVSWTFIEKVPILNVGELGEADEYPRPAKIECEIVEGSTAVIGADLVLIDTSRPWSIEAQDGTSRFLVLRSQVDCQ